MPIAIVTGASIGFGRALATDLAKDGWSLVVDGRRPQLLADTAELLSGLGADVRSLSGDVADPEHRAALTAAAVELGGLDLLVNNASTLGPSPLPLLADLTPEVLRQVYEVNVIAPWALTRLTLPLLRRSRGTIISVSSDAAVEPYPGWGGYGSSKAALDQLFRVWGVEQPDLHVYQFDPGDMRTEMHQAAFPGEDITDRPEPEAAVAPLRRLMVSGAPSGRHHAHDGDQT
jgi:NAD(P)-dependent dehydrogenase (short-subunit alcohol dehydrogenase family)